MNLFLGEYDKTKQLILESFHRDGEVYNGRLGADFWRVCGVSELRRHVQLEWVHHVELLVTNLHLQRAAGPDEVLLQDVVECRVQLLADVFYQQRTTEWQAVFQVSAKVFVIQVSDLQWYATTQSGLPNYQSR